MPARNPSTRNLFSRQIAGSSAMARVLPLVALAAAMAATNAHAQDALPNGGQVVAGSASIASPSQNSMTITQGSDRAIINWQGFSVGEGYKVDIQQRDTRSVLLNRVTGDTGSVIAGQINANGQVYLINPNGIAITRTGSVNAAGFVASSLDISDDRFMAGDIVVTGRGGAVSNAGRITIVRGGYAALIGGKVDNSGLIAAPLGQVALGAGTRATLDLAGDGFLQVALPSAGEGGIAMSGRISADGGSVLLTSASAVDAARHVVNLSGTIEARSVSGRNGAVVLTGSDIQLTGAQINVSAQGSGDGGTVRIGGDYQGGGTLAHALTLDVDATSRINADGAGNGRGGDIVLWSDNATRFAGTISARGAGSGAGGDAEVSSRGLLDYRGTADLRGSRFGTLLLDPYNITISNGADSNQSGFTANGDDSVINVTTLTNALASANVTVMTGSGGSQAGDITVAAPIAWSANSVLTLNAAGNIAINADITASGANAGVALVHGSGKDYRLNGGRITLPGANASFSVNGDAYTLIRTVADLQNMQNALSGRYALAGDIDASDTVNWNAGAGFAPVGAGPQFTGTLTGLGHGIRDLTINRPMQDLVGLIGYMGSGGLIRDLGMIGGTVTGNSSVGGLVGDNSGTVQNVHATGAVSSTDGGVGGLVGENRHYGTVENAYATGAVSGMYWVGGLVGSNTGTVENAYATGAVSDGVDIGTGAVSDGVDIGGLIGYNAGTVRNVYATGAVRGDTGVGGLAGYNSGTVSNAYATGAVSGTAGSTGGLIGRSGRAGVGSSYWDSYATGQSAGVGSGPSSGVSEITSKPSESNAANYAFSQSAYDSVLRGFDFTNDWVMFDGTRPFLRSEWSTTITNAHQLQLMAMNPGASYTLGNDIDASETGSFTTNPSGMWNAKGFSPVGDNGAAFSGTLSGLGHGIRDLTINRPTQDLVGLIGYLGNDGLIRDLGMIGGTVSGGNNVGGLVAFNETGTVENAYATGAVTGFQNVGGLVGINAGTVSNAYATGAVSATGMLSGGLVGGNTGTVQNAYATGAVTALVFVGGLVGYNSGTMQNVYATGAVRSTANLGGFVEAGGLVWGNGGTITNGYWDRYATGLSAGVGIDSSSSTDVSEITSDPTESNAANYAYNPAAWSNFATAGVSDIDIVGGRALTWRMYAGDTMPLLKIFMTQATVNVSGGASLVYNGQNQIGTGSYTLSAGVDPALVLGSLRDISGKDVGTYVLGMDGLYSGQQGYDLVQGATGALIITPRALTWSGVTAAGKVYDGTSGATLTGGTLTGVLTGDQVLLVRGAGVFSDSNAGVGKTIIVIGTGLVGIDAANYSITNPTGLTADITPRALTIAADALSRIYGDANPALTYQIGGMGLVNGDSLTGALKTDATQASGIGNYAITQDTLTASANYAVTYQGANLTITPRALTITADALSRIYGDANPTSGTATGDNLVNGDSISSVDLGTTATLTSGVGGYDLTASNALGTGLGNYTITYATRANGLAITPRALTVTADSLSRIYGNANPALRYLATGLVNGDTLIGDLATTAGVTSNVGSYAITQGTLAATSNYTLSFTNGTLNITPRALVITANDLSRIYGDANPALTYVLGGMGLVNGDSLTGALTTNATQASAIGSYTISQGSLAASNNYALTYQGANLTITPRALTVTADALSRIYGDANPTSGTATGDNLVNGDSITSVDLATTATLTSGVGSYDLTASNALGTGLGNYTIAYATRSNGLTITPRALTITADALSRIYGDANPTSGTATGDNLVNGDSITSVSLGTAAASTSGVGSYDLTASNASGTGLTNYAITYATRIKGLTITPRALKVTADDLSRFYGNPNPTLTYTVGGLGLVNGDMLSGVLATDATLPSLPGLYAITLGTLTATPNYALTFIQGSLTITLPRIFDAQYGASTMDRDGFVPRSPVFPPVSVFDPGNSGTSPLENGPAFPPIQCFWQRLCPAITYLTEQ